MSRLPCLISSLKVESHDMAQVTRPQGGENYSPYSSHSRCYPLNNLPTSSRNIGSVRASQLTQLELTLFSLKSLLLERKHTIKNSYHPQYPSGTPFPILFSTPSHSVLSKLSL
uniref:Uncharacterized protein n=1 Tax=Cacopsylla melanoneura TaxID=428564 RepID=A0A8D8UMH0_9HEMI